MTLKADMQILKKLPLANTPSFVNWANAFLIQCFCFCWLLPISPTGRQKNSDAFNWLYAGIIPLLQLYPAGMRKTINWVVNSDIEYFLEDRDCTLHKTASIL